jgi:hypothetical protein
MARKKDTEVKKLPHGREVARFCGLSAGAHDAIAKAQDALEDLDRRLTEMKVSLENLKGCQEIQDILSMFSYKVRLRIGRDDTDGSLSVMRKQLWILKYYPNHERHKKDQAELNTKKLVDLGTKDRGKALAKHRRAA